MEMYKPSLDWENELPHSLLWVGKGWLISATILLVVLVALARYTTWGRQFWRITGAYFTGRRSVGVGLVGRAAVVGHGLSAPRRAAQLLQQ